MFRVYEIALKFCAACSALTLIGCAGSLKVPLNERSHVQFEANQVGKYLELSYKLYEKSHDPDYKFDPRVQHTVQIKGLGALYESHRAGSPAGDRIEKSVNKLWDDSHPTPTSVYNLVMEDVLYVEKPTDERKSKKKAQLKESAASRARTTLLPLAELPVFLFSSRPGW